MQRAFLLACDVSVLLQSIRQPSDTTHELAMSSCSVSAFCNELRYRRAAWQNNIFDPGITTVNKDVGFAEDAHSGGYVRVDAGRPIKREKNSQVNYPAV
jgi:hypothetical protein